MGVDLVEYNIGKSKRARQELIRKSGGTPVPFLDIDGTYIRGYNERAIRQAVDKALR
jgi:hypothetical protein